MKRKLQGRYVEISTVGERAKAFVPDPLPPTPPITWTPALRQGFDAAMHALGRLDAASDLLPDTPLFLYTYIRKEAVLSSMIEGTQSSLSDLLVYELDEAPGVPLDDVQEVSNYVAALEHGMQLLRSGLPISLRLIREVHGVLLQKGRGAGITPGRFRRSQNWIGGTRPCNASFIPPPPQDVRACMSELESFMHGSPQSGQALLTAGLAHVQFETIHPFLDGNGRVGRLLVTLLLCERGVLRDDEALQGVAPEHVGTSRRLQQASQRCKHWCAQAQNTHFALAYQFSQLGRGGKEVGWGVGCFQHLALG